MNGPVTASGVPGAGVDLSVIAPAHNEAENVPALVEQIASALTPTGRRFEVIIVDDGSTDATRAAVTGLMISRPWLRCVAMTRTPPGRGGGQSAAFCAGLRAARGTLVATIDADLQNDPADLPRLIEHLERTGADLVQGDRSHARRDVWIRRVGSLVGRSFRRAILGDTVRDTGCSLRVMRREAALQLPLVFRGMHRFIPVLVRDLGYRVEELRVNHRPRVAGVTKYGLGITQRALPGMIDGFAVRWMRARRRPVDCAEVAAQGLIAATGVAARNTAPGPAGAAVVSGGPAVPGGLGVPAAASRPDVAVLVEPRVPLRADAAGPAA